MRQLIAGNWKMHGPAAQLPEIAAICRASAQSAAEILICPPSTLIARAVGTAAGRIAIGGQDCAIAEIGPCTGDVSAKMLKDAGATAVIVGHSERRRHHGGSVDPSNAASILQLPEVCGALVGAASLTAAHFRLVLAATPS